MHILAVIQREERKLEKQVAHLQKKLGGLRMAARALGRSTTKEVKAVKKRVMSKASREKIAAAAKKRWAKVRSEAKKLAK